MGAYNLVNYIFQFYGILLICRIALTWIPHNQDHAIVSFLYKFTDPYLNLFRSLPLQYGGFDFSAIVAFFVLDPVLKTVVLRLFL